MKIFCLSLIIVFLLRLMTLYVHYLWSKKFFVLTSIGSTKAPGLDGFIALFYKKYWSIVKMWSFLAFRIFFGHNHLLKEQNHTFIALIPKQLGASTMNQFKPISLCNIIYKIILKILANRFKAQLHLFISPY
jgi:hypothetical protein